MTNENQNYLSPTPFYYYYPAASRGLTSFVLDCTRSGRHSLVFAQTGKTVPRFLTEMFSKVLQLAVDYQVIFRH